MTVMRLHRYPSSSGGIALGKMGVGAVLLLENTQEEEMYKEMYQAVMAGVDLAGGELIDNVTTVLSRPYSIQGVSSFTKAKFLKVTTTTTSSIFRGANNTVHEIDLPELVSVRSGFHFYGNSNIKILRVPKLKDLGSSSLQSTTSLTDVFMTDSEKPQVTGFPWGSTNANTVFHFSDGDYDYQGNKLN